MLDFIVFDNQDYGPSSSESEASLKARLGVYISTQTTPGPSTLMYLVYSTSVQLCLWSFYVSTLYVFYEETN